MPVRGDWDHDLTVEERAELTALHEQTPYSALLSRFNEYRKKQLALLANKSGNSGIAIKMSRNLKRARKERTRQWQADFDTMVSDEFEWAPLTVDVRHSKKRAHYHIQNKRLVYNADDSRGETYIHEMGHALEDANPSLLRDAKRFFVSRLSKDDEVERMRDITGLNYGFDEIVLKDKFKEPYTGKLYTLLEPSRLNRRSHEAIVEPLRNTEIVSMGLETMYQNPAEFAQSDPGFFDFIYEKVMRRKPDQ